MLFAQIVITSWSSLTNTAEKAGKRAAAMRRSWPAPPARHAGLVRQIIRCDEGREFEGEVVHDAGNLGMPPTASCPFEFTAHQADSGLEIQIAFDRQYEKAGWLPGWFYKEYKADAAGRVKKPWSRPPILFSLALNQTAHFSVNYYQSGRTLAGRTTAGNYHQLDARFAHCASLATTALKHPFTCVRDETVVLR